MSAVRDTAHLRFTNTIDGTKTRRRYKTATRPSHRVTHTVVDRRVLQAARKAVRPGEKFVPVDAETMVSVYIKEES